ncbi:hypothetical protein STEG23_003804 [Scotinomys teguina]
MCRLSWFLDPGGWSKTTTVRLYFIFPGICTLSLILDNCLKKQGMEGEDRRIDRQKTLGRGTDIPYSRTGSTVDMAFLPKASTDIPYSRTGSIVDMAFLPKASTDIPYSRTGSIVDMAFLPKAIYRVDAVTVKSSMV